MLRVSSGPGTSKQVTKHQSHPGLFQGLEQGAGMQVRMRVQWDRVLLGT